MAIFALLQYNLFEADSPITQWLLHASNQKEQMILVGLVPIYTTAPFQITSRLKNLVKDMR